MSEPEIFALGASVPRREGREKLTGAALYVDDLPAAGVWFGGTVRSQEPHARLLGIDLDPAFPWGEVVVVTAVDIDGENVVALLEDDQPALASGLIRHSQEPVALVAAPTRELLTKALAAVRLRTEPLRALLDLDEALTADVVLHAPGNLFKTIDIVKGDVEAALAQADVVFEGTYTFGSQEQLYIEPQGIQAEWRDGRLFVRGSMQCPYYIVKGLTRLFGISEAHVRVLQDTTGGGFGGKEEYPTMLACHAALLARRAARPVRITYERGEDMLATPKRHPGRARHRTGFTRDGRIVAMDIDFVLDGGAYCTLSPVVLSRGAIHAAGPYACDNVRVRARAVATNYPPFGAFRGFGAPQSIFAREAHLDDCAEKLGIDPAQLRRDNSLGVGGTLVTGQEVGRDVFAREALDCALIESDFDARRSEYSRWNLAEANAGRFKRRGIGLAAFHHGSGFTGAGEAYLSSVATLRGNADGTVTVLSAQSEIGQGTRTILAQAAALGLKLPVEFVLTTDPDTAESPNSGPTVASRTAMIVGGLLVRAGATLRAEVARRLGVNEAPVGAALSAAIAALAAQAPIEASARYETPADMHWDDASYRGDAYAAYSWCCQVAAIQVDVLTAEVQVLDFTSVQEVGRVLNPVLAGGQVEGGVAQGLGWALLENVVWKEGRMANASMTDYIVPTSLDTPPIRVVFLDLSSRTDGGQAPALSPERVPHGAKGIGELPVDGPAAAVACALRHALGVDLRHVPATPERILAACDGRAP